MHIYEGFPYRLELGGEIVAAFTTARGLRPPSGEGLKYFPNITLLNGKDDTGAVSAWRDLVTGGAEQYRKDGAVIRVNGAGNELERWEFFEAFPRIFEDGLPPYDIKEVDIVVERTERVKR